MDLQLWDLSLWGLKVGLAVVRAVVGGVVGLAMVGNCSCICGAMGDVRHAVVGLAVVVHAVVGFAILGLACGAGYGTCDCGYCGELAVMAAVGLAMVLLQGRMIFVSLR